MRCPALFASGLALVAVATVAGCRSEGSPCTYTSYCDDGTLVHCEGTGPSSFGHLVRTNCVGGCVGRADELASCVESLTPCDPATFVPYCREDYLLEVVVCTELFRTEPRFYPVAIEPGCAGDAIYTCQPDGSAIVETCTDDNSCNELVLAGATSLACAFGASTCDPADYVEGCSVRDHVVTCRDLSGSGDYYPFALPAGEPGAMIASCP